MALIVIIIALLIGVVAMMPSMNKQDTNLTFKGKSEITEGGSLKVKLTDANGTVIANQTVNVTLTDKDKTDSYYSVITNENGTGTLKLDKSHGKYDVTISYGGNDKYKASNATKKITIEKKVVETQETKQSSTNSLDSYRTRSDTDVVLTRSGDIVELNRAGDIVSVNGDPNGGGHSYANH